MKPASSRKYGFNSTKGSSLIMMIVMITVLFLIASTLLFVVLSFFKLNKVYQASENLYFETSRATQVLAQQLELRIADIIENEIPDPITDYTSIFNEFGSAAGYSDAGELETMLSFYAGSADTAIQDDVNKALFDITFKLMVQDDPEASSILYHDATTTPDNNPALTYLQTTAMPAVTDPNPPNEKIFEVKEVAINTGLPADVRTEIVNWLSQNKSNYDNGGTDYDYYGGLDKYGTVVYTVQAENEKAGLGKKLEVKFQTSSHTFTDVIDTKYAAGVQGYNNSRFGKVLAATGNIDISGAGTVNLNGGIYAYGSLPADMTANIIDPASYGGIRFNGSQTVNITGDAITRGYLSANESNSTINITGHAVCDTLYLADDESDINFTVGTVGNNVNTSRSYLSTFDDIRAGSSDSHVRIVGSYFGLNEGSTSGVNKSSSVILNTPADSDPSDIRIDGQALIGGVTFVGNITRDIDGNTYAFRTGESTSIGNNFLLYGYRLDQSSLPAPESTSNPSYDVDVANDYPTWDVEDISGLGSTQLALLDPNASDQADIHKTHNLKSHFYHYIRLRESATDGRMLFNFQPSGKGIILNKNKRHYAPGIISAQAYPDSDGNGMAEGETLLSPLDTSTLAERFYWVTGTVPGITGKFESFDALPLDSNEYDEIMETEKTNAMRDVSFYKIYDDNAYTDSGINPNNGATREEEYTDKNGYLLGGLTTDTYMYNMDSDYFYFVTKDAKDIVIGTESDSLTPGITSSSDSTIKIRAGDIHGKSGIIYTKGNVEIKPDAAFTFDGVIISNGGNITIESDHEVNLDNSDIETTYNQPFFTEVRKFFAPGNEEELLEGSDVYIGSGQNARLVGKKLIKY